MGDKELLENIIHDETKITSQIDKSTFSFGYFHSKQETLLSKKFTMLTCHLDDEVMILLSKYKIKNSMKGWT